MAGLIERYAADLLVYGEEHNKLADFYTYAVILTNSINSINSIGPGMTEIPDKLGDFLKIIPPKDVKDVLAEFVDKCREHWRIMDVKIFSAAPLTEAQQTEIENKLVSTFNKQVHMVVQVDESLLGGVRIIAGYTVMDNTIKKKLAEMKKNMYKGAYFK